MDRRAFLKTSGLNLAGMAAAAKAAPAIVTAKSNGRRQAIIILGESVRYDMLSCNAQTGLHTPHHDRIAKRGVRFECAYNVQPVCGPARSAIWTGLYPHTNGMWGNSMPLGDTTHTIGQRLGDLGVHCAFIGKWHLDGVDYFGTGRPAPGWDKNYWYDMRDYLMELSPEDRVRSRKPATGEDPTWTADKCYGHRVTTRALDFLDKHKDEDFLLVVAYDEPHGPSLCPAEYSQRFADFTFPSSANVEDSLLDKPEEQRVWAGRDLGHKMPPIHAKYFFGSHIFIDDQVGRLLDKAEQCAPGSLVTYTSDHGVFLESHRLSGKGPAMYDEITRVPFLVQWPGHTPEGVSSSSLVSQIDLSGTLMEFFGFEVPKTLEGGSMLPLIKDPKSKGRDAIFMEWGRYEVDHDGFGGFQPIRCIFDGRYKLSLHPLTSDELYDLQTDPQEIHNLLAPGATPPPREQLFALHDRLLRWMNETRDPFRGYYWGRRPWRPEYNVSWDDDGMMRQRESDGYLPRELDYATGLPIQSATHPPSGPK